MSQPTRGGDRADREDPPAGSPVSTDGADESVVERMAEPVARRLADVRGWCRRRPAICAVLGFLLLVGGGLLFLSATGERNLFLAVLIAVVSAGVGAVGLLLLNEPVSQYLRQPQNRNRGRWLGFGGLAAGLAVVWLAILVASPALAVVGAVIVLMALLAINALLLSGTAQTMNLFRLGGLGLLVIAPILIWIGDGVDLLSIIGVVVWIVGLVLFKVGLPPWIDEEAQRRRVSVSVASATAGSS